MRHVTSYLFLFVLINFSLLSCEELPLFNGFYRYQNSKKNALIFINLLPAMALSNNDWDSFHSSAFELPHAFEYAHAQSLPFILVIPDVFFNISQLSTMAPWQEGARVALAWTSAYFRFKKLGNIDVLILRIKDENRIEKKQIIQAIDALLAIPLPNESDKSPEHNIQQRLFDIETLTNNNKSSQLGHLESISFTRPKVETRLINPQLSELQANQKRFAITGAAGFIGSHLARGLLQEGCQVIGLDNLLCSSLRNIEDLMLNKNFYFEKIDITQPFNISGHIDSIIHLASVPSPAFYYALPIETLRSGLHGTKNCLDIAIKKHAQFIFSSTSEVYGDPEKSPQPEDYCGRVSPIGKRSQYDMSKRGAETLIKLYFDKFHLDARIVRIFNTYGEGMDLNDGRVVTNFIRAILHNQPIEIYGDGTQTRSFAYVSDTVNGIMKIIKTDKITTNTPLKKRVFNIGSANEFTINKLAMCINEIAQVNSYKQVPIIEIPQFDLTDPKMRCPDLTRAETVLNYAPSINLIDGLQKTLNYFQTMVSIS